jgi:hypothetical protein
VHGTSIEAGGRMAVSRPGADSWSVAVSVAIAAALATIAVVTVEQAGCDDPGHYVLDAQGYELVGGCVEPGDIRVTPGVPAAPAATAPDPRTPRP